MQAKDDIMLLREYAAHNSEEAFAELVSRRVGFVYSAALRQVRDPHLAEEITQAVFIILAQKAGKISAKTILAGWLFKTTRFAAIAQTRDAAKRSLRRSTIEKEMQIQTELQSAAPDPLWEQMSPLLDEALARLGEKDRQAVLLRFFENKSLAEVSNQLGTGEDTARKRVTRALEKLHRFFSQRGVSSTTAIIAGMISVNSVHAAPAGLALSTISVVKGSAATVSILTLVKGTLKLMTIAKLKTIALLGAAFILATGTSVIVTRSVAQDSSVDDSVWARIDTQILNTLPPAFILRPTHFANSGMGTGGGMAKAGNKMLGRAIPFDTLMSLAYGVDLSRVISPPDKPSGLYDLLMTTPDASSERLQAEIKQKLGYLAHRDSRQTDVLQLQLKRTNAPRLHPSQGRKGGGGGMASSASSSGGTGANIRKRSINSQNQPIPVFIKNLQGYFDKPILDQTGLTGNFDVALEITTKNGESESDAIIRALPAQLGLELVPGHELVEILVVERAKQ